MEKDDDDDESNQQKETDDDPDEVMAKIRNKLKSSRQLSGPSREKEKSKANEEVVPVSDSDSDEFGNELEKERRIKRKKKAWVEEYLGSIDHFAESSTSVTFGVFTWKLNLKEKKLIFVKLDFSYENTKCPRSWQLTKWSVVMKWN